tara:strand:- start:595 stop:2343 length:1749 start_codon:yes stop_codon:yes gene_type:complete
MEIIMVDLNQYALEMSWSTRATDAIISESIQDDISMATEFSILEEIEKVNPRNVTNADIYIKFLSLILKEKAAKPIQAIASQLGHIAGFKNSAEAFEWGLSLVKNCRNTGLYELSFVESDWYVDPAFVLDKKTKQKLDKLQYLPPMKVKPNEWSDNHNGGWVWETKHLVLGSRFTKHNRPLAYDVINKLQSMQWEIDAETYTLEKNTNRNMNKKKFLRVINEYLDKPFHFVWRYDSRGRSYSSGYDLNLQSNEYGKALLSLRKKEKITKIENLLVAIANHAGKDKLTWEERIDWAIGQNPEDIQWEEPMLGRKAVRAYVDTMAGKPSGYTMSLDATSSGLQVMAAISGCKQTAKLTNMIDVDVRHDLYNRVTEMMNQRLAKPLTRKIVKQCVMTHYYNSKATPKALLSEHELSVFYEVMQGLLPGAEDVMETINACWNDQADHHTWTMPDGHTVYIPVMEGINATYTDDELGEIPLRYYAQTTSDNYRSLCPNLIHSIDGYVAREMIRRCDFQLSHIHDCFVFSPDYLQDVAGTYREIMAEIAKGNVFQDIIRQITGDTKIVVAKYSDDLDQAILNSSYMLS